MSVTEHAVHSGAVRLRAYVTERDNLPPGVPTMVAVHGYPDTHAVWERVVADLAADHRVVTYDVRGAGKSDAPRSTAAYRTELLLDDLVAVLDQLAGDGPVHLLGHDWGSVQLWDAVCAEQDDLRLTGRVASFTSVSGPSLDNAATFLRRARADGRGADLSRQRRRSWYVAFFCLPLLPELAWRVAGLLRPGRVTVREAVRGLALYRANVRRRLRAPRPVRTRVPVLLVVPLRDAFITPASLAYLPELAQRLDRAELAAGHWVPRTHPAELAALVRSHVARNPAAPGRTRQ